MLRGRRILISVFFGNCYFWFIICTDLDFLNYLDGYILMYYSCFSFSFGLYCFFCLLTTNDGHYCYLDKIVELWTKRNFRCDCGNSKFGEFYCKILPSKEIENVENSYNQNFKGSYCTCGRPYPDPDVEEQVEMIQCCVCEDWFHEEHIGLDSSDEVSSLGY